MTETPTPSACPHCGEPVEAGSKFCESCGKPTGAPAEAPVATPGDVSNEASPADDLGSGPISAVTRAAGDAPPPVASSERRPCLNCGGDVGPDGYCEQCGTKAPTERDHFREQPASWVAGVCDRGIRHTRNEDAMALLASETPGERAVLVVLDGVSNTDDSHIASLAGARAALEVLRSPLPQGMGTPESRTSVVTKVFAEAIEAANKAVSDTTPDGSTAPPSATFVSTIVEGPTLWFANVGDSRAYWLPDGGPGQQLSVDDSAAQLQIEAGVPKKQAETGPQAHAITRWLGKDAPDLTPRVGRLTVDGPGWVLVCSDGLWNYASEPEDLVTQMQKAGTTDPAELALALTDFANASGGVDNITTVLARIETGQNAAHTETQGDSVG
ncbi:MAG: protein phosphatase 2C domain-containing protein [Actinomycetota bacterium]|nr:protein phosphatase 2C domain-containing protein [Actinomycetota bacterium]